MAPGRTPATGATNETRKPAPSVKGFARAATSTVAWDRSTATRAALAKSAHVPCAGRSRRSRSSGREGPVCNSCYRTALSTPAPCASCNRLRILVGQTAEGTLLCKACSFPDEPVERCSACGEPADLHSGGRCPRCTLAARVTDLLSADGASVAQPLQPLAAVLTGADNPYRVLQWLRHPPRRGRGEPADAHGQVAAQEGGERPTLLPPFRRGDRRGHEFARAERRPTLAVRRYPACRRCREGERGTSLGARGRQCAGAPPGGC